MGKSLSRGLRAKWDALISTEGASMGLSDCRVFLENKLVNDVFYEGRYKGRPCIVKCSSRAPDSIANEAAMIKRMFEDDPRVVPEVFASYISASGDMAFVVLQRLSGPSLREALRMKDGVDPVCADRFAEDMQRIAAALRRTGIVHRDINEDNLMVGDDGCLKLIDFQFAVDRSSYRESAFMLKNWKYLYIVFAFSEPLGGATWNDMRALRLRVQLLPETDFVRKTVSGLKNEEDAGVFSIPVTSMVRFKLGFYLLSLLVQRIFRSGDRARNVIDKRIRLSRTLLFKRSKNKKVIRHVIQFL